MILVEQLRIVHGHRLVKDVIETGVDRLEQTPRQDRVRQRHLLVAARLNLLLALVNRLKKLAMVHRAGHQHAGLKDPFRHDLEPVILVRVVLIGLPMPQVVVVLKSLPAQSFEQNDQKIGMNVSAADDAADPLDAHLIGDFWRRGRVDHDVAIEQHNLIVLPGEVLAQDQAFLPRRRSRQPSWRAIQQVGHNDQVEVVLLSIGSPAGLAIGVPVGKILLADCQRG